MISSDEAINKKIVEMRNEGAFVLTIHKWLCGWESFQVLDEQIVLCNICSVLNDSNLSISRNEVRKCFQKFYNKKFHGEARGYLFWIFKEFDIREKTRIFNQSSIKNKDFSIEKKPKEAHTIAFKSEVMKGSGIIPFKQKQLQKDYTNQKNPSTTHFEKQSCLCVGGVQ